MQLRNISSENSKSSKIVGKVRQIKGEDRKIVFVYVGSELDCLNYKELNSWYFNDQEKDCPVKKIQLLVSSKGNWTGKQVTKPHESKQLKITQFLKTKTWFRSYDSDQYQGFGLLFWLFFCLFAERGWGSDAMCWWCDLLKKGCGNK